MMRKKLFFAAGICSFGIVLGILTGCATEPVPVVENPPPPAPAEAPGVQEDVWTVLSRGDGNQARVFFMGELDPNITDSQGKTALHYAAEHKDPFLAAFLLSQGAFVDAVDGENRTPLSICAENLDSKTARVLAEGEANIHFSMKDNNSPARIAVAENGEFLLALLNPFTLSSIDSGGKTILHIAAETGSAGAVDTILLAENDTTQKDSSGKTALDIALERTDSRDHAETAEHLILAGAVSANPLYSYFAPAVRTSNYDLRSSDGMAPLHYIAREGYPGYLTFLLEKNADVNIKNASGTTPLHEAARSGNIKVMEILLDHNAEITSQDAKGNSVLHIAIPPETQLEAVNLFLARGANPNIRDVHGDSPLHIMIILNRSLEVVETLLKNGADVSIRDMDGKTPLYVAVEKKRDNYLPLLLAYKSDIFATDNSGITPYEKALFERIPGLFSLITDETVFLNDSKGNTMLHLTVAAGINGEIINAILNHGASINARNNAGDTSLTIAVRMNRVSSGELLLKRGADIFAANSKGESPLYLVFPKPGEETSELRQWVLTPETLTARDGLGNTALHYLVHWRFDSWIPLLIHQGANTEASNATGETPLFAAVKQDSPSTIKALISTGAVLTARDSLGNSALHMAVRWNAIKSVETLIDLGLDINCHALNGKTPLHDAIRLRVDSIEKLLIQRGANIELRDSEGNTPFMEAVIAGNPAIMKQLADMGTDTNTRNYRGDTALHMSAALGRMDTAAMLLDWGASIHARNARNRTPFQDVLITSPRLIQTFLSWERLFASDDSGSSPLHIAVQERAPLAAIQTILELGAAPSSVDAEGRTPLRLAVDMNLWETVKLLTDWGTNVFVAARDDKTAAEIALEKGEEAVRAMFSGVAINVRDPSMNSILHYAARQGNTFMISTLLSLGASKEAKNISSESPADIALRWKHPEAAQLLQ